MRRILLGAALAASVLLAGCADQLAKVQATISEATQVFTLATTETVPASVVIPAANAFDVLKATATTYGQYCIDKQFTPSICSADIRRKVVAAVRSGSKARDALEGSVRSGTPALAAVYNTLVAAVQGLQSSPISQVK